MVYTILYNILGDNLNESKESNKTNQEIHIKLSSIFDDFNFKITNIDRKNVTLFQMNYCKIKSDYVFNQIQHFDKLCTLNLSSNNLTSINSVITNLTQLKTLDVSNNNISDISCHINKLNSLTKLNCSHNNISIIPISLYSINSLVELNISNNNIEEISKEIKYLKSLKTLLINNNKLSKIPNDIYKLSQLEIFWFYNNKINELPITIIFLPNMQSLSYDGDIININDIRIRRYLQKINQKHNKYNRHNNYQKKVPQNINLESIKKIIKKYGQNYQYNLNYIMFNNIETSSINILKACYNNPIIYYELQCNFLEIMNVFLCYIENLINEHIRRYAYKVLNKNIIKSELLKEICDNRFMNVQKDNCDELLIFTRTLEKLRY